MNDPKAAKLLYTEEEVKAYTKNRMNYYTQEKKITKFIEALWRLIFYGGFVIIGFHCLFYPNIQPYILTNTFWIGWPETAATASVTFYYQAEIGAYFHQLLYTEVSRSDSTEMIIHHFVTLCLLIGSYMTNFTRMGSFIIILHDFADIFLELGKSIIWVYTPPPYLYIFYTIL